MLNNIEPGIEGTRRAVSIERSNITYLEYRSKYEYLLGIFYEAAPCIEHTPSTSTCHYLWTTASQPFS